MSFRRGLFPSSGSTCWLEFYNVDSSCQQNLLWSVSVDNTDVWICLDFMAATDTAVIRVYKASRFQHSM